MRYNIQSKLSPFALRLLLILMLGGFLAGSVQAGEITFSNRIYGIQIAPGIAQSIKDDLFPSNIMAPTAPNWDDDLTIYSAQGRVILGIDRETLHMATTDVDVTVEVNVSGYDAQLNQQFSTKTLTVHYDGDQTGENEQIKDFVIASGLHSVTVQVLSVTVNGTATVPDFVYLENQIVVDRTRNDWDTKWNTIDDTWQVEHSYLPEQTQLEVSWEFIEGAEEYELEWTFVHSPNGKDFAQININNIYYDFRYDATRIQTGANFYRIPIMYEAGYLVYRLRGIHTVQSVNGDYRIPSEWTSTRFNSGDPDQGSINDVVSNFPTSGNQFILKHYGSSLVRNWQSSVVFAEEGKHVASAGFFDGTLRTRQNIVKNNADSVVVVSETLYDYQGRPAVQTLPVPAIENTFPQMRFYTGEYSPSGTGFNQNLAGEPYDKEDFDEDNPANGCGLTSPAMGTTYGSGYYYSPNSIGAYDGTSNSIDFYIAGPTRQHLLGQYNIPDANGYPFVQTTFVPDATGRIATQSIPGPDHKLGSGHESKYFYGSAFQEELDRLFGSEVGFAEHYRKNMVVDANGQVSVSYLDGSGRTIATALAGETPDAMVALDDNVEREDIRIDLLERNREVPEEGLLISRSQFLVTSAGRHDFEYEIQDQNMMDPCVFPNCYDCVYDLEISLVDDCGEELLPGGVPVSITVSGSELTLVCSNTEGHITLPDLNSQSGTYYPDFFADLDVGKYTITKTLKVNEAAIDFYTDDYLNNNHCIKTLDDFLTEEMANIDISDCNIGCEDCGTSTPEGFCEQICETDWCGVLYEAMLADVSPGGQYAQYQEINNQYYPDGSINLYQGVLNYNDLCIKPVDLLGNAPSYTPPLFRNPNPAIFYANGSPVSVGSVPLDSIVISWEDEWAESYVHMHPEYCYYEYCMEIDAYTYGGTNPHDYGIEMMQIETYADAVAGGYLAVINDPLYQYLLTHLGYPASYALDFNNGVSQEFMQSGMTLYEAAHQAVNCPGSTCAGIFGTNPVTQDEEWRMFRNLYIGYRQMCISDVFEMYDGYNDCQASVELPGSNTTCGSDTWSNKVRLSPDFSNIITPQGTLDINDANLTTNGTALAQNLIDQSCADQCEAYRPYWESVLSGCTTCNGSVNLQHVLDDLEGLCEAGCNANNPFGSSSVPAGNAFTSLHLTNTTFLSFQEVLDAYFTTSCTNGNADCSALLIQMPMEYDHPIALSEGCNAVLVGEWDPEDLAYGCSVPNFNTAETIFPWKLNLTGCTYGGNDQYPASAAYPVCSLNCACTNKVMGEHRFLVNNTFPQWDPNQYDITDVATSIVGNALLVPTLDANCIYPNQGINPEDYAQGVDREQGGMFLAVRGAVAKFPGITNVDHLSNGIYNHIPVPYVIATPIINWNVVAGEQYEFSMWVVNLSPGNRVYDSDPKYWPLLSVFWETPLGNPNAARLGAPRYVAPGVNNWHKISYTFTATAAMAASNSQGFFVANHTQSHFGNDFGFDNIEIRSLDCCIDCGEMTTLLTDFDTEFGYVSTDENYWVLFTTYANNTLGYSLTAADYEAFHTNCINGGGNRMIQTDDDVISNPGSPYVAAARQLHPTIKMPDANGNIVDMSMAKMITNVILGGNGTTSEPLILCNTQFQPEWPDPCVQEALDQATYTATERFEEYMDSVEQDFRGRYVKECLDVEERFEHIYDEAEYYYTLYYYDNSGNLQQTVPPEGVYPITAQADLDEAADYRQDAADFYAGAVSSITETPEDPDHNLQTRYRFTSLNGTFQVNTPDKGESRAWYDNLGRGVLSQDARQKIEASPSYLYSYTEYDELSRPTEVGEAVSSQATASVGNGEVFLYPGGGQISIDPDIALNNPTRQDITYSWYDESNFTIPNFGPRNLRNRVSHTARASSPGNYQHLSHYSYDEHGNVDHLVQEIPELVNLSQSYKHITYDYDLISGNVISFDYQPGEVDAWYHRYAYDANNRLRVAETSENGYFWDKDEKGHFYLHGPSMRSEIGEEKVQATDYASTIHGWTRGVNSGSLTPGMDMGRDALAGNVNEFVAKDAWGFELGFYNGDYSPIGGAVNEWHTVLNSGFATNEIKGLYNGNIAWQVIANEKLMEQAATFSINQTPLFKRYRYDQLNRIASMRLYQAGLSLGGYVGSQVNAYKTDYTYDHNGNIQTLKRWSRNAVMDEMSYAYNRTNYGSQSGKLNDNRLYHVNDAVSTPSFGLDIEDQGISAFGSLTNYEYDAIGNLVQDKAEEIGDIIWDRYGKIVEVLRTGSSTKDELAFAYDASGNRFRKQVIPDQGNPETQFYVCEPSGKVMAIYKLTVDDNRNVMDLQEQYIYGSHRIGVVHNPVRVADEMASGQRVGGGIDGGEKTLIISALEYRGPLNGTGEGKAVILENVSDIRVSTEGLHIEDKEAAQGVALPENLDLDPGERFVIAYGDGSRQGMVAHELGLDTTVVDTTIQWVWQEDLQLNGLEGTIVFTYTGSDLEEVTLDETQYGPVTLFATAGESVVRQSYQSVPQAFDLNEYSTGGAFLAKAVSRKGGGFGYFGEMGQHSQHRGRKAYEFKDHLDNVSEVTSDRRTPVDLGTDLLAEFFRARIVSARDFYPFGMVMPGRSFDTPAYRYGFQGQEGDGELLGEGNSVSYKYRITDSRLGRFFSIDPLTADYPWYSPYQFGGNKVLWGKELEGLENEVDGVAKIGEVWIRGDIIMGPNSSYESAEIQLMFAQARVGLANEGGTVIVGNYLTAVAGVVGIGYYIYEYAFKEEERSIRMQSAITSTDNGRTFNAMIWYEYKTPTKFERVLDAGSIPTGVTPVTGLLARGNGKNYLINLLKAMRRSSKKAFTYTPGQVVDALETLTVTSQELDKVELMIKDLRKRYQTLDVRRTDATKKAIHEIEDTERRMGHISKALGNVQAQKSKLKELKKNANKVLDTHSKEAGFDPRAGQ